MLPGDGASGTEPHVSAPGGPLHVLIVDADPTQAASLEERLAGEGYAVDSRRVADREALEDVLRSRVWDIVIADDQVPGLDVLDGLAVLRELAPDTPCIVVSGAVGEDAAVEAMRADAQDFVVKGRWARLGPAVAREVAEARHRREQRASLERSELRFRQVVENMGGGLIITDLGDLVVYANPRLAEMVGRALDELQGRVAYEVLVPPDRWHEQRARNRDRALGRAEQYETEFLRADGERRWVQINAAPSLDSEGRVVGTIAGIVDVTDRRRALQSVRELNVELEATAAAYRQLANFSARIEQIHDIDALIDAGLQDLVRQLRFDLGVYYVIQDDICHVTRHWGEIPLKLQALHHQEMRVGQGLVGTVAATGEGRMIPDYRQWPGALPGYVAAGLRTQLSLPVRRHGATVGVISLGTFGHLIELDESDRMVARSFVTRLENALERVETIHELTITREQTFRALGVALEYRDYETKGHTDRVVERALAFGRAVALERSELQALQWGAYLHDLGKIAIPDDILLKPGRLTPEEFAVIRNHTVYGFEMTRGIPFLPDATRSLVRNHHERWNGEGYPDGLRGEAIPLMARMFSLVDVYDALVSDRPYKQAWTHPAAVEEIRSQAGKQFDPELTEVFLELIAKAPDRA